MESSKLFEPRRVTVSVVGTDPNDGSDLSVAAGLDGLLEFGGEVRKVLTDGGALRPVFGLYVDDEECCATGIDGESFFGRCCVVGSGRGLERRVQGRSRIPLEFFVVSVHGDVAVQSDG